MVLLTFLLFLSSQYVAESAPRWTPEEAWTWYREQPWFFGASFVPSTSVNDIDMWQTFDRVTINRELGWAAGINMNIMRVFLHFLVWQQDSLDFYTKMNEFLSIADSHKIKIMFVLFDECWNPDPHLGPQPEPIPGVHN